MPPNSSYLNFFACFCTEYAALQLRANSWYRGYILCWSQQLDCAYNSLRISSWNVKGSIICSAGPCRSIAAAAQAAARHLHPQTLANGILEETRNSFLHQDEHNRAYLMVELILAVAHVKANFCNMISYNSSVRSQFLVGLVLFFDMLELEYWHSLTCKNILCSRKFSSMMSLHQSRW